MTQTIIEIMAQIKLWKLFLYLFMANKHNLHVESILVREQFYRSRLKISGEFTL